MWTRFNVTWYGFFSYLAMRNFSFRMDIKCTLIQNWARVFIGLQAPAHLIFHARTFDLLIFVLVLSPRVSIYNKLEDSQDSTARTGQPGQNNQNRTARTGQPERNRQKGIARNGIGIAGQAKQESQNRTGKKDC
jgi:hypothetical protein